MSFSVTGTIQGQTYTVTWENGEFSGDAVAVDAINARADALEGKLVGPETGPFTEVDHLSDPLSAVFVADAAFDKITDLSGDVPEAPDVPEGAVA